MTGEEGHPRVGAKETFEAPGPGPYSTNLGPGHSSSTPKPPAGAGPESELGRGLPR